MGKSTDPRLLSAGHEGQTQAAPATESTQYESLPGLNFNLADPHAESRSEHGAEAALAATEYEGSVGGETTDEAQALPPQDALLGSYEAGPPLMSTEVIIGSDDRVRVGNTGVYPWRAICGLKITAANGRRFIGTGWLVAPRTVITAGHCVFMHNEGGWARSVEVVPGLNDASRPFGSAFSGALRSVTGWTQSRNREYDYGAIILPANARLGDRTGWFGLAVRDDAFLRSAALNLSGYPGDKGGNQQWFMAQRAKATSGRVITYDIDTMGGQSGSPVWVLQNGQRYGVGVHTNGSSSGNSATRINSDVFNRMMAWKNEGA
jgi:glutamyl endopeptidase